jgi:hypothetical protein
MPKRELVGVTELWFRKAVYPRHCVPSNMILRPSTESSALHGKQELKNNFHLSNWSSEVWDSNASKIAQGASRGLRV